MTVTTAFSVFSVEPFPTIREGDSITDAILTVLDEPDRHLLDGDIVVVASKVVSISEKRYVDLATVTPSPQAREISAHTGKPAAIVQLILDESTEHYLATPTGPIIARHTLGYQLTCAGIDRAGTSGAWLPPIDPRRSARHLRAGLSAATGADVAVVIADSDGRADRRGATMISLAPPESPRYASPSTPTSRSCRAARRNPHRHGRRHCRHHPGPTRTSSAPRRRPQRGLRAL